MKPICPTCNSAIADADFNVATEVAYCRKCGKDYVLSTLIAVASVDPEAYEEFQLKYCSTDGFSKQMEIGFPKTVLLYLIPFTCMWSGFSLYMTYIELVLQDQLRTEKVLLAMPFLIATIVLVSVIYTIAFGKWEIRIDDFSLRVKTGVFPFRRRKEVQLNQITAIKLIGSGITVGNKIQKQIAIVSPVNPIEFGAFTKRALKPYIYTWLKQNIKII